MPDPSPSAPAPEWQATPAGNPFGPTSTFDRPMAETRGAYTNRLAVPALVTAILVWPVGLVLSVIAVVRAARRGGVGRSPAVAGLVAAVVMAAVTFGVAGAVRDAQLRNDPGCVALSDLTGAPTVLQDQIDRLHSDRADGTAIATDLYTDAAGAQTLDFSLQVDAKAARDSTVRSAVQATERDVALYSAGIEAEQKGDHATGSREMNGALRLAEDRQKLKDICQS